MNTFFCPFQTSIFFFPIPTTPMIKVKWNVVKTKRDQEISWNKMENSQWFLIVPVVIFSSFFHVSLAVSTDALVLKPLNGTAFAEIGKSFSFQCLFKKIGYLTWFHYSIVLATCENCQSPCEVNRKNNPWENNVKVTCDRKNMRSILTIFNLTRLDHTDYITCQTNGKYIKKNLLVGRYSKKLHPQNYSQVPVIHQDFSLVCNMDNSTFPIAKWFNQQGQIIAYFIRCFAVHEGSINPKYVSPASGRNLTCNRKDNTSTLTISPVEMSLDGTSVGCFVESRGNLYLYTFTVHVPVETVEIQPFNNTDLFEGTEKSFVSGKFFKSKSVLKLTLHRSFKTILCKATVANLPWVESANMELDVTPDNKAYIIIITCLLLNEKTKKLDVQM
ncbi:unnamed protein product [Acanthosepion pharaonis]|uniref:Uncharacterized protein n=1 Tax=Acanthosepion pharaonis TaxID=158019 RepID=A0A812BCF1_ACAPH|nr:unnamed protein product [Sepia pharaonis]